MVCNRVGRLRTDIPENRSVSCFHPANSPDPTLNGAWARAVDVESMEVHGVNNDYEWSTWAIEAGWTVAEIAERYALGNVLGATSQTG